MKEFPWEDDVEAEQAGPDGKPKKSPTSLSESVDICPFDTLILSVFSGSSIHPSCVGPVFPSALRISQKFNLRQHTSPIETPDGEWVITTWTRKSRGEIQKIIKVREDYGSDTNLLAYISSQEKERAARDAKRQQKQEHPDGGKYDRFIDATTGKYVEDHTGKHFASRSPQFNRKQYPHLSEREFTNRKKGT